MSQPTPSGSRESVRSPSSDGERTPALTPPTVRSGRGLLTFIARDPFIILGAVGLLALVVAYLVNALWSVQRFDLLGRIADLALLVLVIVASVNAAPRREGQGDGRFWNLLTGAFVVWLAVVLVQLGGAPARSGVVGLLLTDTLYLFCYILFFIAAFEIDANPRASRPLLRWHRFVDRAALVFFCFALLVYAAVIPGRLNPDAYQMLRPSFLLYASLDLVLIVRFLGLAVAARRADWRLTFVLLGVAFVGWGSIDLLDMVHHWQLVPVISGTYVDFLWYVPFLLVVAAVRLRHHGHGIVAERVAERWDQGGKRVVRSTGLLAGLSVLLPSVHFAGYSLGLLDTASRTAREATVVVYLLAMAGFVVAHVALQSALLALRQRMERSQRLEVVGRVTSGLAHDFNNVLQVIKAAGELLSARLSEGDDRREQVGEIIRASDRGADLTRQLLALSRQQATVRRPTDLNRVVRDVAGMMRRVVEENVAITLRLADGLEPILADPSQIEQVVMNLVLNARDAMPGGGEVVLATQSVSASEAPGGLIGAPGQRYVRLTVQDGGHGMDRDTLSRVFEPFFSTKEGGRANGLGMAVVDGIVAQSEGLILLDSEPGKGTTVSVYLPPTSESAEPVLPEAVVPVKSTAARGRLLLVEDDATVRSLLAQVLAEEGFEVEEAGSGEEALELMGEQADRIDMVISDVMMPGMGGRGLAARVAVRYPKTRMLLISGHALQGAEPGAGTVDGFLFLQKPFSGVALARRVAEMLES